MQLTNQTPFVADLLRTQLHYRDLMMAIVIVKASFEVQADGSLVLASEQLNLADGDSETPLGVLESDMVPVKQGCDFAVYGPAISAGGPVSQLDLAIRIGTFHRAVRVTGDRVWEPSPSGGVRISAPRPFTAMPLSYQRAFGGEAMQPEGIPSSYGDNPLGCGWVAVPGAVVGTRLPNVEEVDGLITSWEQRALPAGLLPLPRTSAMRGLRGVTADLQGQTTSLDPSAFCWSHPRMLLPRYPGPEIIRICGMTEEPQWEARLPSVNLMAHVTLGETTHRLRLVPDTLGVVPAWRRLWLVARRAFVYQFLPERERLVRVETTASPVEETTGTTIAQELGSPHRRVPIEAPLGSEQLPIPWQMLRELHPLTRIIENLPLCASG